MDACKTDHEIYWILFDTVPVRSYPACFSSSLWRTANCDFSSCSGSFKGLSVADGLTAVKCKCLEITKISTGKLLTRRQFNSQVIVYGIKEAIHVHDVLRVWIGGFAFQVTGNDALVDRVDEGRLQ